jgi:Putative polyhydroxyalkanoic acid system protein (PHA_gran_rgn)
MPGGTGRTPGLDHRRLPFAPAGAYIRANRKGAMANTITINVPHDLGVETAKKKLSERMEALRREYVDKIAQSDVSWSGDVATVRVAALGQTATAQITVLANLVRIEVQLPWLLAALGGRVQNVLASNASDVLKIGKS